MTIEDIGLFLMGLLGLVLSAVFARSAWRNLFPARWETVSARVVRSYVEAVEGAHRTTEFRAHVKYDYVYGSFSWNGTAMLEQYGSKPSFAEEALREWHVGRMFTVQVYRPDPRESRLDASSGIGNVVAVLFGVGCVLFSLVMCSGAA
jgi:hypothetical protein